MIGSRRYRVDPVPGEITAAGNRAECTPAVGDGAVPVWAVESGIQGDLENLFIEFILKMIVQRVVTLIIKTVFERVVEILGDGAGQTGPTA